MRPNTLLASLSQRLVAVMLVSCLIPASAAAQLTQDQKIHDFENLAGNYAKRYAPYEWKKQLFGFDLFDLRPWLTRIRHSQDDLSFFEIMLEYVASLQDTHSQFSMPSSFVANLGFTVDIYDGRVMVDSINRTRLPLALYPFSHDRASVEKILRGTLAGGVSVNDTLFHFAVATLPFGGIGPSGMGAYHGRAGFDAMSKQLPILWQARRRPRIFPTRSSTTRPSRMASSVSAPCAKNIACPSSSSCTWRVTPPRSSSMRAARKNSRSCT